MFFIVSKILTYFFRPAIWLLILFILGLSTKKEKKRKIYLWISLAIFVLFSNSFFIAKITDLWAVSPKALTQTYDVGVVLGGSTITYEKKYDRKIFKGNIDRLLQAVELYQRGKIKRILITGASGNLVYRNLKEARLLRSFLISINFPADHILMDTLAENTHENAIYSKKILKQHPEFKNILLVTSSLHMRRARACFRHEGIEVTPYPTNLINSDTRWNFEYMLMPNISNFLIWNGMMHEIIGYQVYRMMGYI
jgi:uncharacterized SAM-binding protein YcdF (DUF218 family)